MISVEKSRLYIYDKKHKKAIKVIDGLIKKYPIDADLYVLRGDIKQEIKNTEGALADYNKALEIDPHCAGAQIALCVYYSEKYDLTNEQKEKLEKELRESGNVTLNICYNYNN